MKKRKEINAFSVSFLDILAGALGAVIILFIVVPKIDLQDIQKLKTLEDLEMQVQSMDSLLQIVETSIPEADYAALIEHSKNLPKVSRLISKHHIAEGDNFKMLPNFKNFQRIKEGQIIAEDINGNISASDDSLILMPLYQKQGEDGFFLIQKLEY